MNNNISINNGDLNNSINNEVVDHLIIAVHGIGKHEGKWTEKIIRMNTLYQTVTKITEKNKNVKFVGLEWHAGVHNTFDRVIKKVTPTTIPVVRELINHTLLDILLFTSPTFGQHIYTEVGTKLNQIYKDFMIANPTFKGKVSILAHSLGSMICYDILCHQIKLQSNIDSSTDSTTQDYDYNKNNFIKEDKGNINYWRKFKEQQKQDRLNSISSNNNNNNNGNNSNKSSSKTSTTSNTDDTSDEDDEDDVEAEVEEDLKKYLLAINFPKLEFDVFNLYCIGSPIGIFCTVRGHQSIDIPNCVNLFNVYDPSDPVASLIEPLIDEGFCEPGLSESIAPHFKTITSKKRQSTVNNNVQLSTISNTSGGSTSNGSTATTASTSNNSVSTSTTTTSNSTTTTTVNNVATTTTSSSMFSKLSSKISSVMGKNSNTNNANTIGTPNTNRNVEVNNTALQLTTQKALPNNSNGGDNVLVEETEMLSFDGASTTTTTNTQYKQRTSSFNGSSVPSSDSEFDDESSERSERSERGDRLSSTYNNNNLNFLNQQLQESLSTPKKSLNSNSNTTPTTVSGSTTPNKPLPTVPPSTNNNNNNNNNTTISGKYFGGYRFDFKLKQTGFSTFSDYSSVPTAHKSYWESKDVMLFISDRLSTTSNLN